MAYFSREKQVSHQISSKMQDLQACLFSVDIYNIMTLIKKLFLLFFFSIRVFHICYINFVKNLFCL